ncbi:MAG: type II secretion system protein [Tepidisphaerales bacterium]
MNRIVKARRGFTLVEILIVVIILGILAAIVIPQFTNASNDARKSSLTSQLQTLRSQIQLYALQHLDQYPPLLVAGGANAWDNMTVRTNADHTTTGTPQFGPYLQAPPVNSLNGSSSVGVVTGTTDFGSGGVANPAGNVGWVFNSTTGKVWATSARFGFIYNEGNPADPNNAN